MFKVKHAIFKFHKEIFSKTTEYMRQPLSNSDYLKYPMPNSNQWIDFGLETVTHRQMEHLSLYRLNRVNPQQPHISTHCKADATHSRSSWSSCEKVKRQCSLSQKSLPNNRSSFLYLLGLRAQGEGVHTRATAAPSTSPDHGPTSNGDHAPGRRGPTLSIHPQLISN